MKKYFMFAAVAGMLVSCSSESLTGSDPKIEPTQDDRVPIEITVASPEVKGATRSVGTVGDVAGGTNIWKGEKVNVFMFTKAANGSSTLNLTEDVPGSGIYLYDNVALTTPNDGASASGIANELTAGDTRIVYKYYPASGNFDFWGYFADDAVSGAVTNDGSEVTVPFTITGAQDLMVAKAVPTAADITLLGTRSSDYYSAYAARKTVQPDMTFKHLLTRLTFSVVGYDNAAIGWKESTPGAGDWALPASGVYTGIFVKSIKVKSKFTGEIIAAYTGADRTTSQLISFDNTAGTSGDGYDMLSLQSARSATTGQVSPLYDETNTFTNWTSNSTMEPLLTIGGTHWAEIMRPTSTTGANSIGGALLVSTENSYDIEVELGQYLLVEEDYPTSTPPSNPDYKIVYSTITKTINPTAPDTFKQGYSYNVKMTLYGYEKIDITTTLEPWGAGTEVEFTAD